MPDKEKTPLPRRGNLNEVRFDPSFTSAVEEYYEKVVIPWNEGGQVGKLMDPDTYFMNNMPDFKIDPEDLSQANDIYRLARSAGNVFRKPTPVPTLPPTPTATPEPAWMGGDGLDDRLKKYGI